jgi:hypothetical protein
VGSTPSSGTIFLATGQFAGLLEFLACRFLLKKECWAELNRFNMACVVSNGNVAFSVIADFL